MSHLNRRVHISSDGSDHGGGALVAYVNQSDVGQLLDEICDDLREPVTTIHAAAAAALTEPGLGTQVRLRLEQIAGQAGWLANIVNDCTRTERPDGTERQDGEERTSNCPANVTYVVNEAVAACRLAWPGDVSVTSPPGPVLCALHPVVLRRVISNVLSNATRAAGPSGVVTVEVNRSQSMTILIVEDSGPGFGMIPQRYGIGLAEVARNVIGCGGRLECGPGARGGARISLWLP
jgi:signal transduction histidine kinase